ncbi:GntR family transcriptional regulator [Microbacterium capsulatum]|uniref:GntR family transcriptional regulator n=1 Tax=Microbacterium capsulatum TaxID=3041921 RepID=A0ABU0XHS9_9MICO|nr:GntR family transcriptional regulator [Microbacterium sp. ASV81]MDQ4214694.1 GntR family transcriptional regulator [Microbacterium sp. ASV81]
MARGSAGHGATGAMLADALREAILDGRYAPGERIRQDELAESHGISRLPVREALRMLESEGLVTVVANTGAWVSELSLAECEEMYRMRERLEPLLLGLNVPLLDEALIDRLAELAELMERTDDVEEFLRLDWEFHLSSVSVAPTSVLGDTVVSLWNRTQHYRRAVSRLFSAEGDRRIHYDHRLIVGALRGRDAVEAEQMLAAHVRRSRLELLQHPEVFSRR